uniref:N-acetyllactosaminide beta-1,3-N-acetylglucosaminyltransferase n=1 Tax=Strongyloides stercoralis TaxID=6248 RepID=A0A0K0E4F5_STRER
MYLLPLTPFKILLLTMIILLIYFKVLYIITHDPFDVTTLKNYITKKSYTKVPFIYKSNIVVRNETCRITLILHSSYEYISNDLKTHLYNWDGPISIAITFNENISKISLQTSCILYFFDNLYYEIKEAKEKLSVHFLYTNTIDNYIIYNSTIFKETVRHYFKIENYNKMCRDVNGNITIFEKAKQLNNYPINVARNFARKHSNTKYILIADMNHLFSKNFEKKMINLGEKFLNKTGKYALTYRIFEISKSIKKLPYNKKMLKNYIKKKKAFEFHHYMSAHKIPLLNEWFLHPESNIETGYQFITNLSNSQWEPQFVSLTDIPYHDETFFYPVRDNTVLRWEMCYQKYQFVIAHDVFMFHHGIKSYHESLSIKIAKDNIFPLAFKAMNNFDKKMKKKYSQKNDCPKSDKYSFGPGLKIQNYLNYPKIFGY